MLEFKQFHQKIQNTVPRSILEKPVLRVHANTVEEVQEEAVNYFHVPVSDLHFEIERKTSRTSSHSKKFMVLVYPKDSNVDSDSEHRDEDSNENMKGSVHFRKGLGSILVLVVPPKENFEPISFEEAFSMLKRKNLSDNYDEPLLRKAVKEAAKEWVRIGSFSYNPVEDTSYTITYDSDEIVAYIEIFRSGPFGKDPSFNQMKDELKKDGVVLGIDEERLMELELRPVYGKSIEVARGTKVENGKNASVRIHDSVQKDFKNSKTKSIKKVILTAKKNEIVAEKKAATNGIRGETVKGKILLPKPGNDVTMSGNKNVIIIGDNTKAISKLDGSVKIEGNKIIVEELLIIDTSLSLETGDINFPGSVHIRGDISDDFTVTVGADLQVDGGIANSIVKVGGDLNVNRGIKGKGSAEIEVGGNLVTGFIEGANINVYKDCIVNQAIILSNVFAKGRVIAIADRGRIISSHITAGKDIFVRAVGSASGRGSVLEIKSLPELRKYYEKLQAQKIEKRKKLNKINLYLGVEDLHAVQKIIEREKANVDKEEISEKEKVIIDTVRKIKILQTELKRITEQSKVLAERLVQATSTSRLCVIQHLKTGTKISIDNAKLHIKNDMQHIVFYLKDDRIGVREYNNRLEGSILKEY